MGIPIDDEWRRWIAENILLGNPVGWWHYVRGLEVSITMTFTNFVFDNDFYSIYRTYGDI